jgi:hypothetical protein
LRRTQDPSDRPIGVGRKAFPSQLAILVVPISLDEDRGDAEELTGQAVPDRRHKPAKASPAGPAASAPNSVSRSTQQSTEAATPQCRSHSKSASLRVAHIVCSNRPCAPGLRPWRRVRRTPRTKGCLQAGTPPPHPNSAQDGCGERRSWLSPRAATQRRSGTCAHPSSPSPPGGFARPDAWAPTPLRASLPTRGDDHSEPDLRLGQASRPACLTNRLIRAASKVHQPGHSRTLAVRARPAKPMLHLSAPQNHGMLSYFLDTST